MAMAVRRHIHAAAVVSVGAAAIVAARLRASRRDGRRAGGGGKLERGAGPCAVTCHDYTYLRNRSAKLRRDYAKKITHALRIITQLLRKSFTQQLRRRYALIRRNYANKLRTLRKYYAKVTQIIYAIITQCLRNFTQRFYAKMFKHNTQ